MAEETNDMIPADPEKKLPAALDRHLRTIIPEKDLMRFREQLPEDFIADASEGLENLKDSNQLESVLKKLNQQMHHQLSHKKTNKMRRPEGVLPWTYWAIVTVLLLTIAGFVLIRMILKH
jgi:hypothetical protein